MRYSGVGVLPFLAELSSAFKRLLNALKGLLW